MAKLQSNTRIYGSATIDTNLSIGAGGIIAGANVIYSNIFVANSTTTSISNTTGAIISNGGLGVKGNVYADAVSAGMTVTGTLSSSGVATFAAGSNTAPAITTTGDTNTGIFFPAADTIAFAEGGTEAMRLDSSGRVGIGTSSPTARLQVSDGTTTLDLNPTGGVVYFGTSTNHPMIFNTNNTERMRLDTSGNLLFNSGYGSVATAYGCRAWVKFNGVGTVSITASAGVTSITDNGTGDYTVNFSITFPDAHYALGATCDADTTNGAVCYMNSTSAPTTTACRLATKLLNNTSADRDRIMALFIR